MLEQILDDLEREHAEDFRSGFIAESPRKLRRIHQYFAAVCGVAPYPPVRCNAPEFSAVIGGAGRVSPCFFISGPPASDLAARALGQSPEHALDAAHCAQAFARAIARSAHLRLLAVARPGQRSGRRPDFLLRGRSDA